MAIREFVPIGLCQSEIHKGLRLGGNIKEFMLMSLKPILYGFWCSSPKPDSYQLDFVTDAQSIGNVEGNVHETIFFNTDLSFVLWSPQKTNLSCLTVKQKLWEFPKILRQSRKGKFRFSQNEIAHLSAAYFYPRKINVVVVRTDDYLNVFPMDLHLQDSESEAYAFGLQVTNLATSKIQESNRILVCELEADSLATAYALGKNHGRTNLHGTTLPYESKSSKHFNLPVPNFAVGYKEIEIEQCRELGSHMLFLGNVVHQELPKEGEVQPYHIHRFYHDFLSRKRVLTPAMNLEIS